MINLILLIFALIIMSSVLTERLLLLQLLSVMLIFLMAIVLEITYCGGRALKTMWWKRKGKRKEWE